MQGLIANRIDSRYKRFGAPSDGVAGVIASVAISFRMIARPRALATCTPMRFVSIDVHDLQLGFVFASGATIIVQFHKLLFRRRRINRSYDLSEIYG